MIEKDKIIDALDEYADDDTCGLTAIQVAGIRKQIFRQMRPVEIAPVQKIVVPDTKSGDLALLWVAVLAAVLAVKEIWVLLQ